MNNYMHERYCRECEEFKEDHDFRCDVCGSKLWTRIKLKDDSDLVNIAEVLRADEVEVGDRVYFNGLSEFSNVLSSSPKLADDSKQYIALQGFGSHLYSCDEPFYSVMGRYTGGWD